MDLACLELNGLPILRFREAEDFRCERRLLVTWQSEILAFLLKQSQAFVWERWVQQWPRVGPDLQLWYTAFLQCVQGLGLLLQLAMHPLGKSFYLFKTVYDVRVCKCRTYL